MRDLAKGIERALATSPEDSEIAAAIDDPEEVVAHILDPERRGELYPFYHRLRELAPAHRSESPGLPPGAFVLTSFRNVDRVARSSAAVNDPRTAQVFDYDGTGEGAFYRVMSRAMLFLEKSAHDRIRRLVYKAFTPAAVAPLRSLTERVAHELLDAAESAGRMDFVEEFAYPLPLRAILRLLGLPRDAESTVERWVWDFARAGDPMTSTPEIVARGDAAAVGFHEFFSGILEDRRRRPGDDLISALLAAEEDGGKLDREEAISTLVLLLQGGPRDDGGSAGECDDRTLPSSRRARSLAALAEAPARRRPRSCSATTRRSRCRCASCARRSTSTGSRFRRVASWPWDMVPPNRDPGMHFDPDRLDLDRNPTHLFLQRRRLLLPRKRPRSNGDPGGARRALRAVCRGIRPEGDRYVQRWTTRLRGPLELRVAWG